MGEWEDKGEESITHVMLKKGRKGKANMSIIRVYENCDDADVNPK